MAFHIIRDDITLVSADAIVNTANPEPVYAGGTDSAIYEAAGAEELLAERIKIGRIAQGQAIETPAFSLDAKYIIHTVGPSWQGGDHQERETVRSCYENSLRLAEKLGCESIAFPLIATGIYGFPKDEALQIAISVFSEFLLHSDMEITLVVFDKESFVLTGKLFSDVDAYIDEYYVDEMLDEEYRIDEERIERSYFSMGEIRDNLSREGRRSKKGRKNESGGAFFQKKEMESAPYIPVCEEPDIPEDMACDEDASVQLTPDEIADMLAVSDEMDDLEDIEADIADVEMPVFAAAAPQAMSIRSLDDLDDNIGETWAEMLFRLIDEKGFNPVDVYKRSNINKKLFSKINSNNDYHPNKKTAVAFAIGLHLNLDEAKDFLSCAGYAFSRSSKFDLIVQFFIEQENYDMFEINEVLFDHDQDTIGV